MKQVVVCSGCGHQEEYHGGQIEPFCPYCGESVLVTEMISPRRKVIKKALVGKESTNAKVQP